MAWMYLRCVTACRTASGELATVDYATPPVPELQADVVRHQLDQRQDRRSHQRRRPAVDCDQGTQPTGDVGHDPSSEDLLSLLTRFLLAAYREASPIKVGSRVTSSKDRKII